MRLSWKQDWILWLSVHTVLKNTLLHLWNSTSSIILKFFFYSDHHVFSLTGVLVIMGVMFKWRWDGLNIMSFPWCLLVGKKCHPLWWLHDLVLQSCHLTLFWFEFHWPQLVSGDYNIVRMYSIRDTFILNWLTSWPPYGSKQYTIKLTVDSVLSQKESVFVT